MRKYVVLSLFFFIVSVLAVAAYAEQISGRYVLNSNNNIGYIDIDVNEDVLTGSMQWFISRDGSSMDQSGIMWDGIVEYVPQSNVPQTVYIRFTRSDQPQQTWHGWFSYDRKLISGYVEIVNLGRTVPWYAIRLN